MLELIARSHPPAWLLLSSLHEELDSDPKLERARHCLERFLETDPSDADKVMAWSALAKLCNRAEEWGGEAHALVGMCQINEIPFETISNSANRLNWIFKEHFHSFESDQKRFLPQEVINVMQARLSEGDATACSRLAWLYMHTKDEGRARQAVEQGLARDPTNEHRVRLAMKLELAVSAVPEER
jgi:hypothetical protein